MARTKREEVREHDDLDDMEESESVEAAALDGDEEDSAEETTAARAEAADEHSIAARQQMRERMAREIEEFLARGGKIQVVEPNVSADPPRKPVSEYGSRPL